MGFRRILLYTTQSTGELPGNTDLDLILGQTPAPSQKRDKPSLAMANMSLCPLPIMGSKPSLSAECSPSWVRCRGFGVVVFLSGEVETPPSGCNRDGSHFQRAEMGRSVHFRYPKGEGAQGTASLPYADAGVHSPPGSPAPGSPAPGSPAPGSRARAARWSVPGHGHAFGAFGRACRNKPGEGQKLEVGQK